MVLGQQYLDVVNIVVNFLQTEVDVKQELRSWFEANTRFPSTVCTGNLCRINNGTPGITSILNVRAALVRFE